MAAAGVQLVVVAGGGLAYAWRVEPDWLRVEQLDIPITGLPAGLEGVRIAQISDLHAGPDLPPERLNGAVQTVAAMEPDLLVITGDWVTYDADDAFPAAEVVARCSPPGGTYSILGNHDHWTRAERVAEAIQSAGHMLLRNSHTPISFGEETLWLAGLDDIWEQQQDLDAALAGIPDSAPIVLLVHEPDYADTVAADGRVALQLSGHSHGGQVRLPALGSPVAPHLGNKYISGLYWVRNRMWVYTNRGLGTIPPTVRFNCRPEITLITLRSATPRTGEPDPPTRRI
jgi:hypothetical protein